MIKVNNTIIGNNGGTRLEASFDDGKSWMDFSDGLYWSNTGNSTKAFMVQNDSLYMASELALRDNIYGAGFWKRPLNEFTPNLLKAPNFLRTEYSPTYYSPFSTLKIFWNDVSNNEKGFAIERNDGMNTTFKEIARVDSNLTSYSDVSAKNGIVYTYQVRAFNDKGLSKQSNTLQIAKVQQCDDIELRGLGPLRSGKLFEDNSMFLHNTFNAVVSTNDFGNTWQSYPTPANVSEVNFYSKNLFFAVGFQNAIHKSTDGGKTWTSQKTNVTFSDNSESKTRLQFVSDKVGFSLIKTSSRTRIYKTIDGGTTWSEQPVSFTQDDIYTFDFVSEKVGIVMQNFTNKYFLTTNGGTTWVEIKTPANEDLSPNPILSYYLIDEKNIILSSYKYIWVSNDAGTTWKKYWIDRDLPIYHGVSKYQFSDANNGIILVKDLYSSSSSGNNFIYKTTDGGKTWVKVEYNLYQSGNYTYFVIIWQPAIEIVFQRQVLNFETD
jgi:photosystem II stability/assembly factor-like uncharacterized protein